MLFMLLHIIIIIIDRTKSTFMHLCVGLYERIMSLKSVLNNNKQYNSCWPVWNCKHFTEPPFFKGWTLQCFMAAKCIKD